MLPSYISKSIPNPFSNRAPWYKNTAPTYAGVFLWIVFYRDIAVALDRTGPAMCLAALLIAGLISYGLFYYIPALMGMRTAFRSTSSAALPSARKADTSCLDC